MVRKILLHLAEQLHEQEQLSAHICVTSGGAACLRLSLSQAAH